MTDEPSLKPLIWVGSSLKDLRKFPEVVQDHMGYALYVAQAGGKHRETKTLSGFGGAGLVEVMKTTEGTRSERCTHCDTLERYMSCTHSRRNQRQAVKQLAST